MADKTLAAVTTDILKTELREFDIPDIAEDAGLLELEAAGICGSDWGSYQRNKTPRIMGHENVGRVVKLGRLAERNWDLKVGDRIALEEYMPCGQCDICRTGDFRLCPQTETRGPAGTWMRYGSSPVDLEHGLWGGYSRFMYLHPRSVIHRVKEGVPAHHLAMAIPMSNGVQWTEYDAGLRMGQTVLIQGPGQQGLAAVLAASKLGAERIIVSGLTRDAARLEVAKKFGAHDIIDVEKEDLIEKVYDLTNGKGVDAAMDLAGGPDTLVNAIRAVKKTGTAVFATGGNIENFPANDMRSKRVTLRAVRGHSYQAVETAIRLISSGDYPLDLMATHQFALDEVDLAVRSIGGEGVEGAIHVSIIPSKEVAA
ncbi:MAG: zinc-binding dehydrogenase [Proteobacteria bacterium]|nr:zinc-binding dehydrogenase [Pseudomonadota bacterium]